MEVQFERGKWYALELTPKNVQYLRLRRTALSYNTYMSRHCPGEAYPEYPQKKKAMRQHFRLFLRGCFDTQGEPEINETDIVTDDGQKKSAHLLLVMLFDVEADQVDVFNVMVSERLYCPRELTSPEAFFLNRWRSETKKAEVIRDRIDVLKELLEDQKKLQRQMYVNMKSWEGLTFTEALRKEFLEHIEEVEVDPIDVNEIVIRTSRAYMGEYNDAKMFAPPSTYRIQIRSRNAFDEILPPQLRLEQGSHPHIIDNKRCFNGTSRAWIDGAMDTLDIMGVVRFLDKTLNPESVNMGSPLGDFVQGQCQVCQHELSARKHSGLYLWCPTCEDIVCEGHAVQWLHGIEADDIDVQGLLDELPPYSVYPESFGVYAHYYTGKHRNYVYSDGIYRACPKCTEEALRIGPGGPADGYCTHEMHQGWLALDKMLPPVLLKDDEDICPYCEVMGQGIAYIIMNKRKDRVEYDENENEVQAQWEEIAHWFAKGDAWLVEVALEENARGDDAPVDSMATTGQQRIWTEPEVSDSSDRVSESTDEDLRVGRSGAGE